MECDFGPLPVRNALGNESPDAFALKAYRLKRRENCRQYEPKTDYLKDERLGRDDKRLFALHERINMPESSNCYRDNPPHKKCITGDN